MFLALAPIHFREASLMACVVRLAVIISAAALLAGCSGSTLATGASGAMPQAPAFAARATSSNYRVVYNFSGAPDGNHPVASLIDVDGTLYGTTRLGGAGSAYAPSGWGTVFSLTTDGTEKVLHSFSLHPDGGSPAHP